MLVWNWDYWEKYLQISWRRDKNTKNNNNNNKKNPQSNKTNKIMVICKAVHFTIIARRYLFQGLVLYFFKNYSYFLVISSRETIIVTLGEWYPSSGSCIVYDNLKNQSSSSLALGSVGCRIHQLHFCRGVRYPNECPEYDTTIWCWSSSYLEALRNAEYPFITIAPMSTLVRSGGT